MRKGDVIIPCNPVVDYTSVSLTVGKEYICEDIRKYFTDKEFVTVTSDKGNKLVAPSSHFRTKEKVHV